MKYEYNPEYIAHDEFIAFYCRSFDVEMADDIIDFFNPKGTDINYIVSKSQDILYHLPKWRPPYHLTNMAAA